MSLYAITTELQSILDLVDAGATDADTAAAIAEHEGALREALASKADSYAGLIRSLEVRADAREAEAKRMQALAGADTRLAERLRLALRDAMKATDTPKLETERFRLSVRANGGKLPVFVEDEAALPPVYRIPVYTERVDRDAVRDALERGEAVPGARLGERGSRLDIK
jgi:hypothetical protein